MRTGKVGVARRGTPPEPKQFANQRQILAGYNCLASDGAAKVVSPQLAERHRRDV